MNNVDSLARFHADPSKVRISVRPNKGSFRASVASRTDNKLFWFTCTDPYVALSVALGAAEESGMEGIDIELQWSYEHPFGRAGLEARR